MQLGQKYKVVYADFSNFEKGEIVTHIKGSHWSKFRFENNKGVVDDLYATDVEIYESDRFPHTDTIDNSQD